jgi:hypothetical protein
MSHKFRKTGPICKGSSAYCAEYNRQLVNTECFGARRKHKNTKRTRERVNQNRISSFERPQFGYTKATNCDSE